MSDVGRRLSKLTEEQRRLLEVRLRERGFDGQRTDRGGASMLSDHSLPPLTGDPAIAAEADPGAWRKRSPARPLLFSLYFFSDDGSREAEDKYRLVLESARFADAQGFEAVWTPERHFQPFGGLYPNPSVLGAALAAITKRVGIRAGSVALPLHNPIRVAEEWSVVDNLSNGRVAVSFASGWHPDDFVLFPTPYAERKETMFRAIEMIRRLWAGETLSQEGPEGRSVEVRLLPRPVQRELPIWVTTAGSAETWERAGSIGANVLAALVGYGPEDLADRIGRYRQSRKVAGHDPTTGLVTLVVHTYVGTNDGAVRERVREPMTHYLESYLGQFRNLGLEKLGATANDTRDIASLAFEHYFESATLLGTQNKCARVLDALLSAGADEVACLVDFGLETDSVLEALARLAELKEHYAKAGTSQQEATGTLRAQPHVVETPESQIENVRQPAAESARQQPAGVAEPEVETATRQAVETAQQQAAETSQKPVAETAQPDVPPTPATPEKHVAATTRREVESEPAI